ncbi:MAG: ABC transporter substrate-binding protein [Planctomycetes bacterium]|nr:ABC transporter substrate-binding protein [Planctomycetota bacterium]
MPIELTLGHSPDPDDAFMWWPLFGVDGGEPEVSDDRFRFVQVCDDIESLNRRSAGDASRLLDITAMSCANLPLVVERYCATACGSSVGDGYGPKLVSRDPMTTAQLKEPGVVIAVPGVRTTSFMVLSLLLGPGKFQYKEVPFDQLMEAVESGEFPAGVVIHEGQLQFQDRGLHLVQDLGAWWKQQTQLPLPLGLNAIRRDLDARYGAGTSRSVQRLLERSVEHAMQHRDKGIEYAMKFARGMDQGLAGTFVDLYVNRMSLDFGPRGENAILRLLSDAAAAGLVPAVRSTESLFAAR